MLCVNTNIRPLQKCHWLLFNKNNEAATSQRGNNDAGSSFCGLIPTILFNHRSFQKPAVSPGLWVVFWKEGCLERMEMEVSPRIIGGFEPLVLVEAEWEPPPNHQSKPKNGNGRYPSNRLPTSQRERSLSKPNTEAQVVRVHLLPPGTHVGGQRLKGGRLDCSHRSAPGTPAEDMGAGQNIATRGPQLLVFGSIYQGSILGTHF